jgi:hypothetical protein
MTCRYLLAFALVFATACGDNHPGLGMGDDDDVTPSPQCSDGKDNDGDGQFDFPLDLGCTSILDETEDSPTSPKCDDGRDNDGDGKFDFPDDPGCLLPETDEEADDCPNGPNCPKCSNGIDDDLNGIADYPDDNTGCESAGDLIEFTENPVACGPNMMIRMLPSDGIATGTLDTSSLSMLTTTCGGGAGSPAIAYVVILTSPKILVASTDDPATTADTIIDLRAANCADPAAHIACNDDVAAPTNRKSKLQQALEPGVYYVIVEGQNSTVSGNFKLTVQLFAGEGEACVLQSDCAFGLVCRTPIGSTTQVCSQPVCNDGLDDDADGKIDFPLDPGCSSPSDGSEEDDCPNGVNCPACANTLDDDGDGQTDFPADTTCAGAGGFIEGCGTEQDPILSIVARTTTGVLAGSHDDHDPTCTTSNGVDLQYTIQLPAMQSLTLDTEASTADTVLSLRPPTCALASIDCDDDDGVSAGASLIQVSNLAAGNYVIAVDGFNGAAVGAFNLNVAGVIAPGGSCENALFDASVITCPTGFVCDGTSGSRTCRTECIDGIDNNGDGKTDFPNDPGCASPADNDENDVCPGAMCPQCSDGTDNDTDGQTDFPADVACQSAGQNNERCIQTEAIEAITMPATAGTLVGQTDDIESTCANSNNGPDVAYEIDLPALQSVTFAVATGLDVVVNLHDSSCGPSALACSDEPEAVTRTNVTAGRYFVVVDGFNANQVGTFTLNTSGIIAIGGSCESPLFTNGVLACPTGFVCDGTAGSRTCRTECTDGIDNNGDGTTDFPADRGCSSQADNDENDVVCPGPTCPACSDGLDNDGDGQTDFPADTSCDSVGGTNEACNQSEPVLLITEPDTDGTTIGQVNDFEPTCAATSTDSGPEVIYQIDLPAVATLELDLDTTMDAVLVLTNGTCGPSELVCRDPEDLTATNLAAGTYYIVVDGFFDDDADDFVLSTFGTIAPGGSCESPLVTSGVLACSAGFTCDGPVGGRTCRSECSDGVDNNGDGKIDFPNDPGCASPADNDENDVCPGAACPQCGDTVDNDADGQIDFPADSDCVSASDNVEATTCGQTDALIPVVSPTTTSTTVGTVNDFLPNCASSSGTAGDVALTLDLPAMRSLALDLSVGFDSVHSLLDSTCSQPELVCRDPADLDAPRLSAGRYFLVVDGFGSGTGAFTLTTSGVIEPGGSCEGPLFTSGAIACPAGVTCAGTPGSRTCFTQCSDGVDNNGDGKIDLADPGCLNADDATEDLLSCPGAGCAVCSDGTDNDTDTLLDFPSDFGCTGAGGATEVFCAADVDFAGLITTQTTTGTLAGAADNFEQSCQGNTGNDRTFALVLPVPVTRLVVDTLGSTTSDTVLSVKDANCGRELGCDDDNAPGSDNRSLIQIPGLAAGSYAINVDSFGGGNNGAFTLNVRGTVASGTACTSPLFASGVLACRAGQSCTAGICQ